jgi:arylsulfatase
VLYATGSENSGISVFIQGDRLVVDYNAFDKHTILESEVPVPTGDSTLRMLLQRTSRRTGRVELAVDGEAAGQADIPLYMNMVSSAGASVGYDGGSAVSQRYRSPFAFPGTLHEVVIQLPQQGAPDAATIARSEMSQQ